MRSVGCWGARHSGQPANAGAGKWREATIAPSADRVLAVAHVDELEVNQMKLLRVGDRRIALARNEDGYVAIDDRCTHRGGSLAGGTMICGTVQCPWHGSQFDSATGHVKAGPATGSIRSYIVERRGDQIYVVLPD